ncbi:hypothetical protein cyc_05637 [Cyclospora cayetanensis]|uniref:Uncharacterized protein n=1 Tax=Cyclospora cayetanensis TaxID=88456 RepID=A0A1D3D4M8_9EIME|nr:hypothetical protein cyc_05637 [Cyclospora cayetanensis]
MCRPLSVLQLPPATVGAAVCVLVLPEEVGRVRVCACRGVDMNHRAAALVAGNRCKKLRAARQVQSAARVTSSSTKLVAALGIDRLLSGEGRAAEGAAVTQPADVDTAVSAAVAAAVQAPSRAYLSIFLARWVAKYEEDWQGARNIGVLWDLRQTQRQQQHHLHPPDAPSANAEYRKTRIL